MAQILPVRLLLLLLGSLMIFPARAQDRCGAVEARQEFFSENNGGQFDRAAMEQALSVWVNGEEARAGFRSVVTIPVVVHIVYNTPAQNIPDEQIISQLDVVNQDFRALNVEVPGVPAVFKPLVADVEIEFCLARVDPNGNPTNGITRRFTNNAIGIAGTPAIHYSALGGQDAWDPQRYLNVWVAKFAGNIGGIASFPGIGLPAEDGVEINYLQFGTINTNPPYHKGRTLTHEIGHYLNLEHPWGPKVTDCCEDDFVADTPKACETYIGQCPTHPVVSCDMPDLFMNYMFYSDDACMAMFTIGQKMRMLATLNTLRTGLLSSQACTPLSTGQSEQKSRVKLLGNPVFGKIVLELNALNLPTSPIIRLVDVTGRVWHREEAPRTGIHAIEVDGLPGGVYFLVVEKERGVVKVVVQR